MKKIILMALITMSVSIAQAGLVFSPSFTFMSRELSDNNNPTQKEELTMIDVKLGYIFEMGLYVGGLYSLIDDELTDVASSDFHFGPSIGYYNSGFFVAATYYVFGQRDQDQTN
ncbi:MAG: hypothetical protein MJK18_04755, partial [Bdellovibrionales bacterium]|nr:hypothetical protein [Bdellovibrionales bacterium]